MSLEWTPKTPRASFTDDNGHVHYKRFIRIKDGAKLYSVNVKTFRALAENAEAIYRINGTIILVNLDIFDEYLESYREMKGRRK